MTEEHADRLATASKAAVRLALERRFRRSATAWDAEEAAAVAMAVVGPVLQARDDEITRLRAELGLGVALR